jgi:diacylglycerol kinase
MVLIDENIDIYWDRLTFLIILSQNVVLVEILNNSRIEQVKDKILTEWLGETLS